MNRFLFGLIGLFFIAIAGIGVFILTRSGASPGQATLVASTGASSGLSFQVSSQSSSSTQSSAPDTYTMAQVAAHNSASSCYAAINGSVYDLTSWISQHPGGPEAILSLCGTDGSNAFNAQHGGQRRPESELANFKIGALIT